MSAAPYSSPGPDDEEGPDAPGGSVVRAAPQQQAGVQAWDPAAAAGYETSVAAVAAQARTAIEARYKMAMMNPRNWTLVTGKLKAACSRPAFADAARYKLPRGRKNIVGPSIRFAEEAVRAMGNILIEATAVYEDDHKRIIRVSVTDLESNLTYPKDVTVEKTIERKNPRGKEVVSERMNTNNETIYRVRAEPEDVLMTQENLVSKAIRNGVLRILPSDVAEVALAEVVETLYKAARNKENIERMLKAYQKIGVTRQGVESYLKHSVDEMSGDEYADMRAHFEAIKDGEAKWADIVAKGRDAEPPPPQATRKEVKAEVIDMKAKPQSKGPPPADPYQTKGAETQPAEPAPAAPATGEGASLPPVQVTANLDLRAALTDNPQAPPPAETQERVLPDDHPPAGAERDANYFPASATAELVQPPQALKVLTNTDLQALYREVDARDLEKLTGGKGAHEAVQILIARHRGIPDAEAADVFTASLTYGELDAMRAMIDALPPVAESDGGT